GAEQPMSRAGSHQGTSVSLTPTHDAVPPPPRCQSTRSRARSGPSGVPRADAGSGRPSQSATTRTSPADAGACRRLLTSQPTELARSDQVDENVPLVLLQPDGILGFPDPDLVALDDDLRAMDAVGAERDRDRFHARSPPFDSMCGQTAAARSP